MLGTYYYSTNTNTNDVATYTTNTYTSTTTNTTAIVTTTTATTNNIPREVWTVQRVTQSTVTLLCIWRFFQLPDYGFIDVALLQHWFSRY